MHRLKRVVIKNYRSCIRFEAELADFTPLVGYNNAGKSNVLAAIRWAIAPWALMESDFRDKTREVSVELTVGGIAEALLESLNEKHRTKIAPFRKDETLEIRRSQATPGAGVRSIQLDVRMPGSEWQPNPSGIPQAIEALFPDPLEVPAMSDAAEDIGKSKAGTTIGRLLGELAKPVVSKYGEQLVAALGEWERTLAADGAGRATELMELDAAANAALRDVFPDLSVRVHVPPPDLKDAFKNGTIKIYEGSSSEGRKIAAIGHGAQRSIQMALIRTLAERRESVTATSRTLLVVDEPELYLHPRGVEQVRDAMRTLSRGRYQVLVATHSPLIVDAEAAGNALLIGKDAEGGTTARPRLGDAVNEALSAGGGASTALLELSRWSEVLFNERVLLVEGDTERRLLPEAFRCHQGASLGARKIGLVPVSGGGVIPACLRILRTMGLNATAIVDLDFVFTHGRKAGLLHENDSRAALVRSRAKACSAAMGFPLGPNGWPCKENGRSAEEGWALLATDGEVKAVVETLHDEAKAMGIWFWKGGSIEAVLGADGKSRATHGDLIASFRTGTWRDEVADAEALEECMDWIAAPGPNRDDPKREVPDAVPQ